MLKLKNFAKLSTPIITGDPEIIFVDSEEKFVNEKSKTPIIVDQYVKNIRNVNGEDIAQKHYFVYYNENNEPDKILTLSLYLNEDAKQILAEEENKKPEQQDYAIQQIKINQFTDQLPKKIMNFPSGCKVYEPGLNLTKDGELFIFTRMTSKGKVEYVGSKKGKVEAIKIKKGYTPGYAFDFGNDDVTKVLNAILPNDNKVEGTVTYERVGSGTLANGQYYVDLKAEQLSENTILIQFATTLKITRW